MNKFKENTNSGGEEASASAAAHDSTAERPQLSLEPVWKSFLRSRPAAIIVALAAAALLIASLKLPLWQMHMEAPQYRDDEALNVVVFANAFRGDLDELAVLNQYIGVHVPQTLPQFHWMPAAFVAAAALGVAAAFLGRSLRSRALLLIPAVLSVALLVASAQAMQQMRDIGHKRDQKTIMAGVKDFTPPFLGARKIAQFTVTSRLGTGSWLVGAAIALQFSAAWFSRMLNPPLRPDRKSRFVKHDSSRSVLAPAVTN